MNLQPAFDRDVYAATFRPVYDSSGSTKVVCTLSAYGRWHTVNGKQARETLQVSSPASATPDEALRYALDRLPAPVVVVQDDDDLEDLLG